MQRETCEPPPEHADKAWHWVQIPPMSQLQVVCWDGRLWYEAGVLSETSPADAAGEGWRYVGPAIPPTEGEGG